MIDVVAAGEHSFVGSEEHSFADAEAVGSVLMVQLVPVPSRSLAVLSALPSSQDCKLFRFS